MAQLPTESTDNNTASIKAGSASNAKKADTTKDPLRESAIKTGGKMTTPMWEVVRKMRRCFVHAAIFSLCLNILMLVLPIYSLQVLDRVMSSHSMETLVMLTIITVVCLAFYAFFMMLRGALFNTLSEWLDRTLAPKLLEHAIQRSSHGQITQAGQYQRDLGSVKAFISGGAATTLMDAPWSIIFIFVVYMINPILGMLTILGVILLIGFGIINEVSTKKAIERGNMHAARSQVLADTAARNADAVEAMGMLPRVTQHWSIAQNESQAWTYRGAGRANIVQGVSRFFRYVIQIAVTGIGGYLVLQSPPELSVGGMIASSILVGRALAPFEGAIMIWKTYVQARGAYDRLNKVFETASLLERGTMALPAPEGNLSVEGLIYSPPRSAPVIRGVTFAVKPGEAVGIIGPSAAGKSTLAKLIIGILPPTHGAVRLDGMETYKWNRENFGSYVGYLPQQVELFEGTIRDNIARLEPDAPVEKVIHAAKRAYAHDMILRLPKGYETECGPMNLSLSPGQRQRIGLARALYCDPRFVVLDEPNSNLDGDGERALVQALTEMKAAGITYVVVAHRPTIVSMVDKLVVMRAGVVERFGPRQEILQQYSGANNQQLGANTTRID